MITGSSKEAAGNKQPKSDTNITTTTKPSSSTSSSWLRLKDPRIVRVSRAFGGKDRHSKVCTVKGLRDRRVRLSVPTAIQLYDLQDRLGLSQPSKVVDWLLNAAKDEIDELPPLQMPPVAFTRNQMMHNSQQGVKIDPNVDWDDPEAARANLWTSLEAHWRGKGSKEAKVVATEIEKQSSQFPKPVLHNNSAAHNSMPYGSVYQWEPNNSTFGSGQYGFISQLESGVHHQNMSSALSLASSSYFPNSSEIDNYQRQINHLQMLSAGANSSLNLLPTYSPALFSIGQSMRPPFHFTAASRPPVQPRNEQNKDQDDQMPSK